VKNENQNELSVKKIDELPVKKSIGLIAKRRPPPLNIGYNELGIKPKRAVLYRNFHEIS